MSGTNQGTGIAGAMDYIPAEPTKPKRTCCICGKELGEAKGYGAVALCGRGVLEWCSRACMEHSPWTGEAWA